MSSKRASRDDVAAWRDIGKRAQETAHRLLPRARTIKQAVSRVYTSAPVSVWLSPLPAIKVAWISDDYGLASQSDIGAVKMAVEEGTDCEPQVISCSGFPQDQDGRCLVKVAESTFLRRLGQFINLIPRYSQKGELLNWPGPVQSMVTGGLLGAPLGYGAGTALEWLFPERWRRGRMRIVTAIAGALLGLTPGLFAGMMNKAVGRPFGSTAGWVENRGRAPRVEDMVPPEQPATPPSIKGAFDYGATPAVFMPNDSTIISEMAQRGMFPLIDAPELRSMLWLRATPQVAGTADAVLTAAQQMPGGISSSQFVTPAQMARLAAHMGAGYLSGKIVGSVLGLLTGMPSETKDLLARTGMYAGVVRAVLPKMFGM